MVDITRFVLSAPKQDSYLTPVHKDETFGLVRYIGAHSSAHDTVPSWQVHRVKLCLDNLCDIVKYSPLLEGKGDAIHGVLLHELIHVHRLHHCVLSFLLFCASMWLHHLSVLISLPLLGLDGSCVSCNLSDGRHCFNQFLLF